MRGHMTKKKTKNDEVDDKLTESVVKKPKAKKVTAKPKPKSKPTPKVKKIEVDLFEVWYGSKEPLKHHTDLAKLLLSECGSDVRVNSFRRRHGLSAQHDIKDLCHLIWKYYKG